MELIAGDAGDLRDNIGRKLDLIATEVSDFRDIGGNLDTNLDRVSVGLGKLHQDLGMFNGVIPMWLGTVFGDSLSYPATIPTPSLNE